MHRAFENVYKFVKTINSKIMARDHISSLYNFKALLHSYKLLSPAIFCGLIFVVSISTIVQSVLRNTDFAFSHWKPYQVLRGWLAI